MHSQDISGEALIIGIDVGGTFTDCAIVDAAGRIVIGKAPTTPGDLTVGFHNALADAAGKMGVSSGNLLSRADRLVHGTTQGTNAIVTRSGARAGLITTRGHGEALHIMAGGGRTRGLSLDEVLDLPATDKPTRIIPLARVVEVTERVDSEGEVVVPLNPDTARAAIRKLLDQGVEAIGICLLWSFLNPSHEHAIRELVREMAPHVHVSVSSEVAPAVGEYPRMATVAMNAYTGPILADYVRRLSALTLDAGLRRLLFANCAGGTVTTDTAQELAILTLQSGPAAGVAGAAHFGEQMGYPNIVTADMGGTTFDVGLVVNGKPVVQPGTVFEQYELHLPMVDVQSVGAGGGSVAWIDAIGGTLKVGPQSAGATPGPVCYGAGGKQPTVTDADLVMGFIDPDNFLGGRKKLDLEAARCAIAELGDQIGLGVDEAAAGICTIVDTRMADLIRRMTLFKGYDPRDFSLFAFGGGSPLHAGVFATELGIRSVVVPLAAAASVWSALGAASSDLSHIVQRSQKFTQPFSAEPIEKIFADLQDLADKRLAEDGIPPEQRLLQRSLSMKLLEQVFELELPMPAGPLTEKDTAEIADRFIEAYEQRYGAGTAYRDAGMLITEMKVRAFGRIAKPELVRSSAVECSPEQALHTRRSVYWVEESGRVDTPVYDGERLERGAIIAGPAIIEFSVTTVAVRPGQSARLDEIGNLVMTV